jgi:signal transduction histidine kinase
MDPATILIEREAAILQAVITVGLALLFGLLHHRYRRPHFLWWCGAWVLYTVRIALITTFLITESRTWLYFHQVVTVWTAFAVLAAALSFERRQLWRPAYWVAAILPVPWAYVTIYRLDSFLIAAILTVALLGAATLWTGFVFLRYRRRTGSAGAGFVAGTLFLWGLHHLDYPLLRARGLLAPWSYYLDSVLILTLGVGVVLLVMEELQRGLRTLSTLSGDLHRNRAAGGGAPMLLTRALDLAGVTGSALWTPEPEPFGSISHGLGACESWRGTSPGGSLGHGLQDAMRTGRPVILSECEVGSGSTTIWLPFAGLVPVIGTGAPTGVAVLVGASRAPFTALDEDFLLALGQQFGAALESADLDRRLKDRTAELERLSLTLIRQHEDQRRRLARELHDETAQVFSAMIMQLGLLREAEGAARPRLDTLRRLVDTGMESIRRVADDLRPPVLDDLGLAAALHTVAADFGERSAIPTRFDVVGSSPVLGDDSELALFRVLQEALANVARHAEARSVAVELRGEADGVSLAVVDDGRGFDPDDSAEGGRMGLVGMQERIAAVGGRLVIQAAPGRGARLVALVPALGQEDRP